MLSKKMAFSLTSLITIFALALTVSIAEAADDFDATLSVVRVSTASDHNAVYGEDIEVTLTFGAQVDGTEATLTIFVEDKFGALTPIAFPTGSANSIKPKDLNSVRDGLQNDGKTFTFTIPAAATNADDAKVHMLVAAGVAEIVPVGSVKTSKEGKLTIDLVGPDAPTMPEVVSIALAPGVIVPAAGYTGATIDVIITLSEAAKAFTAADHLNITDTATAADPVALDPVAEQTASELQTQFQRAGVGNPPRFRDLYDEIVPTGTPGATDDGGPIENIVDPSPSTQVSDVQRNIRAMYGGVHRAIAEAGALREDGAYTYDIMSLATGEMLMDGVFAFGDAPANQPDTAAAKGLASLMDDDFEMGGRPSPTEPSTTLKETERHPSTVAPTTEAIAHQEATGDPDPGEVDFPAGTDRTVEPTQPNPGHFRTDVDYAAGLVLFNARRSLYVKYLNEKAIYDAYIAAVFAEAIPDFVARDDYYAEQFGVEVPRSTGRDSMLHPYLVTITPKYANLNAVVVKVKTFEGQTIPAPGASNKYTPPVTEAAYREGIDKLTIKIGQELLADKTAGIEVALLNEGVIPEDGYLVVAKDAGLSAVRSPGDAKKSPVSTGRQPFGLTYNLIAGAALPNLEAFLINGGTIDVVAPAAGLVISEIMWGSDASIDAIVSRAST